MITLTITILVLLIIIGLFITSFLVNNNTDEDNENETKWYIKISAFTLLMLLGLILLISPIQYITGETVITSFQYSNNETVLDNQTSIKTNTFEQDDSLLSYAFSMILLLAGLAGLMFTVRDLWEYRYKYDV